VTFTNLQKRNTAPVTLKVDGKNVKFTIENGYAKLDRRWRPGDVVELNLPMPVRRVLANAKVKADLGRVALQRGPGGVLRRGTGQSRRQSPRYNFARTGSRSPRSSSRRCSTASKSSKAARWTRKKLNRIHGHPIFRVGQPWQGRDGSLAVRFGNRFAQAVIVL